MPGTPTAMIVQQCNVGPPGLEHEVLLAGSAVLASGNSGFRIGVSHLIRGFLRMEFIRVVQNVVGKGEYVCHAFSFKVFNCRLDAQSNHAVE